MFEKICWWIHSQWGRYKLNQKLKKIPLDERDCEDVGCMDDLYEDDD